MSVVKDDDMSELQERLKRQNGYSYRLEGDKFGLDVAIDGDYEVDESEMSLVVPFADGNRRDGVGDLLEISGIDVSRHRVNPIALFDHGKSVTLPLGLFCDSKSQEYTVMLDPIAKTAKGKLFVYQGSGIPNAKKDQEYPHAVFCQQIFDLWVKKFIRAGSIGYQVKDARQLQPDYERGTQAGLHLIKILMLEGSVVVMPANQDTVRKSYDIAREILAMPQVCGKSLSPLLVKSLQPYVQDYTKVMTGFVPKAGCVNCNQPFTGITHNVLGKELCSPCYMRTIESQIKSIAPPQVGEIQPDKVETVQIPRTQAPSNIPPADWKPGMGATKDLCPNNTRITLSDDYGCPSAYDSQRKGMASCKSCGKSLQLIPFLVKDMPIDEIEGYEKALVGSLKKGWNIIYQSKAAIVDDIGEIDDGKIKVLLKDGRKFIADPEDYVKKVSGESVDDPKYDMAVEDGLSSAPEPIIANPDDNVGYEDSLEETEDDAVDWDALPGKTLKSIRSKYKHLRKQRMKGLIGSTGQKFRDPDEMLAGGFPHFVTNSDDRYKLEDSAPNELRKWREAVAKHNQLPSTSAKTKHRKELEHAFDDLKRAYDKMKRSGKSFKNLRSKYKGMGFLVPLSQVPGHWRVGNKYGQELKNSPLFKSKEEAQKWIDDHPEAEKEARSKPLGSKGYPGERRILVENVVVGDKLSTLGSQQIVRKVRRNTDDPHQIELELENGELVYRRTGDPVYVTMRGKSLGWKSYSSHGSISDAIWQAEKDKWDALPESEKKKQKDQKKKDADKYADDRAKIIEKERKEKEKKEKETQAATKKKMADHIKKDKDAISKMKSEAESFFTKMKNKYSVLVSYEVKTRTDYDAYDEDGNEYQTYGLDVKLEFSDWINNKKTMSLFFKNTEHSIADFKDLLNTIEDDFRQCKGGKSLSWKSSKALTGSPDTYKRILTRLRPGETKTIAGVIVRRYASPSRPSYDSRFSDESPGEKYIVGNDESQKLSIDDAVSTLMTQISSKSLGWKSYESDELQDIDSKSLGAIRHKYRSTKGLVRRLRKSASGSSMIMVRSKDMDALEKEASEKGLTINRVGSHTKGIEKVRLSGHDGSIDAMAKRYGRMLRKSLDVKTKDASRKITDALYYAAKWSMDKLESIISELRNMNPADVLHTWQVMGHEPNNRWSSDQYKREIANEIRRAHNMSAVGYASLNGWKKHKS